MLFGVQSDTLKPPAPLTQAKPGGRPWQPRGIEPRVLAYRLIPRELIKKKSPIFGQSGNETGHLAFAGCPSFFVWAGYYSVAYTNAPCHKWLFAHSSMEEFMEELSAFVPFVSFVCFVHMPLTCGFSFVCFVSFVRICLKTELQVQLIAVPSYGRHFCYQGEVALLTADVPKELMPGLSGVSGDQWCWTSFR